MAACLNILPQCPGACGNPRDEYCGLAWKEWIMWMLIARGVIAGAVIVGVTVLSDRSPRLGAFLLTLPLVSILAFVSSWQQRHDLGRISQVARETLVLVPLGLPFFVPL